MLSGSYDQSKVVENDLSVESERAFVQDQNPFVGQGVSQEPASTCSPTRMPDLASCRIS